MASPSTELPSSLRSLWRSLVLGYRAEPLLLVVGFVTTVAAALPDALFALGLKLLVQAMADRAGDTIVLAALLLAALSTATWLLSVASDRTDLRLAERTAVHIESYVARLQSSVPTIEHHERAEYVDRLALLRDHASALSQIYRSVFRTAGSVVRLVVVIGLLMSVQPILGLLVLFALPTVLVSNRRGAVEKRVEEQGAQGRRLARHLFVLGATAAPGKEIRVGGLGERLRGGRRAAWDQGYLPLARARWISFWWLAAAWAIFAAAFVGAVAVVATGDGATAGSVALVLTAGTRLSAYVGQTVNEVHFLRTIWLDASRRMVWLEDFAAAHSLAADLPVPTALTDGIEFKDVTFRYPGAERAVLRNIDLRLPAGKVVAVVGENGAGKSTLVKLLCRFYDPSSGRITVDGADLTRIPADGWRDRFAGAFQDFMRFEYPVQHAVGIGDRDRMDDRAAVEVAAGRAGAVDIVDGFPDGYDTQLGVTWRDGVEVSFGQWQRLALARGFMRDAPLLLALDEPTAAIDAETEHALFERYADAARAEAGSGRITVLVSHRFSTVRMADLIVVLDGAHVAEQGTHDELMARGGKYAELYGIQAAAYQ
ncbi:ABC transporter ATP-binding protein [Kutzneria buriramensis]|uniref:ATP-binding cassette subfamily B protein n=1 Tax=Kutzneria buriramensis TaxID=1045776 RepID=A0A3E0H493_9PSEU|nr:ABC transporter ATP-binding protein [Kutzneria buriramensis]REH38069.1 ATP-binding cassette subfamily B protein [Kutzneria buriramensis]